MSRLYATTRTTRKPKPTFLFNVLTTEEGYVADAVYLPGRESFVRVTDPTGAQVGVVVDTYLRSIDRCVYVPTVNGTRLEACDTVADAVRLIVEHLAR